MRGARTADRALFDRGLDVRLRQVGFDPLQSQVRKPLQPDVIAVPATRVVGVAVGVLKGSERTVKGQ